MIDPDTLVDGRYRVISRIGSGGMADVYLAEDRLLGRQVALKVLHHHFAEDGEFVERFRREASSAAALSHPNIVGIFDRGEWDGTYYIAMEYVPGSSLKTIVREGGALDPARAIDIVIQILRAARSAHRRGVIHRDLKPHNVILDDEGRARVTDFGIARAGASDMTLTGSIMGTAQYLSPEQAQGFAVTGASDLYSIGVILYELLTGAVPFEGETAVAIAFKQVAAEPLPPSSLNPAVPPSLDAVVLRALAKDPTQRFANADELIVALERERAVLPAYAPAPRTAVPPAAPAQPAPFLMAPLIAPSQQHPPSEEPEREQRWWWALLAVLVVAGAVAAALLLTKGTSQVSVPDVGLQNQLVAEATLRRDGLTPASSFAASSTVQNGAVARQTPAAGTRVDKNSTVQLVISQGPASAEIPSVEGTTAAAARSRLAAAGFVVVPKTVASTTVPAGRVLGTEPAAGTERRRGSRVTLLVSSGPAAVRVPSVVGETRGAAESALENAGFKVGEVTSRATTTQPEGDVFQQTPAGGATQPAGTKVALVLAKAPSTVKVPDVVGRSEIEAASMLGAAGLEPHPEAVSTTEQAKVGVILTQRPSAGRQVHKKSSVTIGVGTLATPTTSTPTTTTPATTPAGAPPG